MTVAQIEHAPTLYSDPLPEAGRFDQLETLVRERRAAIIAAADKTCRLSVYSERTPAFQEGRRTQLSNELTAAAMRQAKAQRDIIELARLIVAEYDNLELIGE